MTLDQKSWRKKYQLVKDAWRACRPEERAKYTRVSSLDFGVTTFRRLAAGIEVRSQVSGWQIEAGEWSLRVRVVILDRRVERLRSEVVTTFDTSGLATLSFDVLAAVAFLEGCDLEPSPSVLPSSSDDDVRLIVKAFSDRIDRLWRFVGGFSVAGLETLSIWAIRNRTEVGVSRHAIDFDNVICTAFAYGERELSRELLREYEIHCRKQRPSQTGEAWQKIHATVDAEVVRFQRLLS